MKKTIITLSTLGILCCASAGLAQTPRPYQTGMNEMSGMHESNVLVIVKAPGVPATVVKSEEGKTRMVTINREQLKLAPGMNQTQRRVHLEGTNVKNLSINYGNVTCPVSFSGAVPRGETTNWRDYQLERVTIMLKKSDAHGFTCERAVATLKHRS